jgi:hypothetical protein
MPPQRKTFLPAPSSCSTYHDDSPKCPYCGHVMRDAFELPDDGTVDCDCGKTYYCSRIISVSYVTTPGEWVDPSTLL